MPITLHDLKNQINPERTIILFGAGASIPSGAPSGVSLAHQLWTKVAHSEPQSDDLVDTASILDRRYGRRAVIDEIRSTLEPLRPTGGLLALPQFNWSALFSTNFDLLMERSYKIAGCPLTSIRSNFDFTNRDSISGIKLYKIHGCITQDRSLGDKASMILTEQDYDEYQRYRQSMFSTLQLMMLTNDVIVIGQSLRDRHLHDLVKEVLATRQDGINSQIYVLVYDRDDLRAPLLEDRGAKVIFGGIDEFVHVLASDLVERPVLINSHESSSGLPASIVSTVNYVSDRLLDTANIVQMFNGRSASFADIQAGATFERSRFADAEEKILSRSTPVVAIIGAAGVGKTTFARQIAAATTKKGIEVWEHRDNFPFESKQWIAFEEGLRASGKRALLLIDECTRYMRQANMLLDTLGNIEEPALKVIITANAAQWGPRLKSPVIFHKGLSIHLSRLDSPEINSLINLCQHNTTVRSLVDKDFRALSRSAQHARLTERCCADMFVCLKNIFARDSLDTILLREFEDLSPSLQEYYRYVAALEAVGIRVHRQLLMRMLNIGALEVSAALSGLHDIIDEYDIDSKYGIYGWSTRHIVIARKITDYKFSSHDDLESLFDTIINNINPGIQIERQNIRDLCDVEFGIGRLGNTKTKQRLYKKLIETASGERIPWHRLVRELIDNESLEDADQGLRNALDAVGRDGPLDRYEVRLLVERAKRTVGIGEEDRLALVRRAYDSAESNIHRYPGDKFSYRSLCEVAIELVKRGERPHVFDEAISKFREAADRILDPEMDRTLEHYKNLRAKMH